MDAAARSLVVIGGTGFIGRLLVQRLLERGDIVRVVSRKPDDASAPLRARPWAATAIASNKLAFCSYKELPTALNGAAAVVNLAGEDIAARPWSASQKQRIRDSRIYSVRTMLEALRATASPPSVLLQGSAVGFYGDRGDELLDESSPAGQGFLAETAVAWEHESLAATDLGIRRVLVRTGVVLDAEGGVLARMLPAFKTFLGGQFGSGRQWFPWVHRQDEVQAMLHCLDTPTLEGPVNFVSPAPVTNREFCKTLARTLHRTCVLPVPATLLTLALGEMARELLLAGQRVMPTRLLQSGYSFIFPTLEHALQATLQTPAAHRQGGAAHA
ncbi:TIGR01777 family oxidoreductase [Megalodesulfovibrio paquesii]